MADPSIQFNGLFPTGKSNGYYTISYSTKNAPAGKRIYLCIGAHFNKINITAGYGQADLPKLCNLFQTDGRWGTKVNSWLQMDGGENNPGLYVESNVVPFDMPVKPFAWNLTTRALRLENLCYAGNGSGSWVDFTRYNGLLYFLNSRDFPGDVNPDKTLPHLVANQVLRGLDCTTFPLALFEIPNSDRCQAAPTKEKNPTGEYIAEELLATDIGLNKLPGPAMQLALFGTNADGGFEKDPMDGVFLLWSSAENVGHVMVYRGDPETSLYGVHEFSGSGPGGSAWKAVGYKETCISRKRLDASRNYWAKRIPSQYHWKIDNTYASYYKPYPPSEQVPYGINPVGGKKPSSIGGSPGSPGGNGGQKYTVVSGDSLSKIAGKYWNDVLLWPILYDANKQVVGPDPNKIVPGQRLQIPSISGYSQQQLSDARRRGSNW